MGYSIKIRKRALIEIEQSAEWFKQKKLGLEIEFLRDLDATITLVQKNPENFQVRYKDVRVKFLKKFEFGIHYILDNSTIHILSVFHTSRSPEDWE
ncbi:hypothetical protein FMM05_07340 [Flavobacterium zepuense]|uniref:Plasmid stabilization system protein ParE n=1 Tax=Flavobacterium zepuense TaxID=2593302 RepID=A0A552V3S0_9FLAO|nr:hypothetical protein [Flavobacterium zepuense]TRW25116.1 hypothetical protein FMM05_07340 [Flavobacterium zepuense]